MPSVILAIFFLTYVGVAVGRIPGLKLNRTGIVLLGAIAVMLFGGASTAKIISWINWPTILLLFGFLVISAQLRLSGFYDRIAAGVAARLTHPARFLFVLMAVTAGLSAVLNHDIVCLAFTPIIGAALLRRGLHPVPFLIALAIASNLGAAATLVGNPQNMMIAQIARLDFGRYLLWSAVPVLLSLGAAYVIIWLMSRRQLELTSPPPIEKETDPTPFNRAHAIKGLVILGAVIGLLFTSLPKEIIALTAAGIHLASPKFRTNDLLARVDWPILILFMGLFVVTGAFEATGYGERAVQWLNHVGFDLNTPHTLILATTGLANLINNSPAVMLLLKVIDLSRPASAPVLALANSFGGSLLLVGSVSNLIVAQEARELGIEIGFWTFARLGIPVTLTALGVLLAWVAAVG